MMYGSGVPDNSITNAKIAANAAIVKSKLAALGIVDADVAANAAIVKSKLAALGIVDADVAANAAIAVTKLGLDISATHNATERHVVAQTPDMRTGSFVTDGTTNRAIAHNMGRSPNLMVLHYSTAAAHLYMYVKNYSGWRGLHSGSDQLTVVTPADNSNFYVSPAGGNDSGYTAQWVIL